MPQSAPLRDHGPIFASTFRQFRREVSSETTFVGKAEVMADDASCSTCRYSAQGPEPGKLMCRRYPPLAFPMLMPGAVQGQVNLTFTASFSVVAPHAWCGEYKAKEQHVGHEDKKLASRGVRPIPALKDLSFMHSKTSACPEHR